MIVKDSFISYHGIHSLSNEYIKMNGRNMGNRICARLPMGIFTENHCDNINE